MIRLDDEFSFERDTHGWQLHQWRDGKDKSGNAKRQKHTTYYATLRQVCDAILDRKAGKCKDMAELKALLEQAGNALTEHATEAA